jgi:hypothetical protein
MEGQTEIGSNFIRLQILVGFVAVNVSKQLHSSLSSVKRVLDVLSDIGVIDVLVSGDRLGQRIKGVESARDSDETANLEQSLLEATKYDSGFFRRPSFDSSLPNFGNAEPKVTRRECGCLISKTSN